MQIKTTMRYLYIPKRTAKIIMKNNDNVKFWRVCGEALLEVERYK